MNARDARRLLLVQAFEHTPDATWSAADAAWATAEARRIEGSTAASDALLARRAELAAQRLVERKPALGAWLEGWALPGWALAVALAAAFAIGLALDGLGGQARINVLALPLLGLLGWNLVVYGLLGVQAVRTMAAPRGTTSTHGLRDVLARAATWGGQRVAGTRRGLPALSRFGLAWADAARPLHTARAALALHAMAAAIALGLVAGLYLRGLAFEYRAGWESTFLDARGVHAMVSVLLGPAASLIGDPLPTAEAFGALRFPASAGENAAPWIHRIALTVGMLVVLPRLLLAGWAARDARRLAKALPLDLQTPYFARLTRELGGAQLVVRLQPHGHTLAGERAATIERLIARALGGSVRILLAANARYGDEAPELSADAQHVPRLVLFNATTTPEAEVQGDYLRALASAGGMAAVLIDETDLRRRSTGPDAAARIEQRQRAWRTMLDAIGIAAVFIDLDDSADQPMPALADALGRAGERAMA